MRKIKCWKCGEEYDYRDYLDGFYPKCPKCGKWQKDGKPSVRRKNKIGLILILVGILVAFLSTYIPFELCLDPYWWGVMVGLLVSGIGFFVRVLAAMDADRF